MGWKDRSELVTNDVDPAKSSWKDRSELVEDKTTELDSAFRGGIDSASFGFSDEIAGGLEGLGSKFGIRGLGSKSLSNVRRETEEEKTEPFSDVYESMRDQRRDESQEAREANPLSYLGGQVAGGIATAPLGGALTKGASKGVQAAAMGIGEGALFGAGESEGENLGEIAEDAATAATIGGVAGPVMSKVGDVVGAGAKKVGQLVADSKPAQIITEIFSNFAFDLPPKYTEEIINNPKIKDVRNFDELEEVFVDTAKTLKNGLLNADQIAKETLSTDKKIPMKAFSGLINDTLESRRVTNSSFATDKMAIGKAGELLETIEANPLMSQRDIKELIKKMDNEINWANNDLIRSNEVMKDIRGKFNNFLKTQNPRYADEMEKVAPLAKKLNLMEKNYNLNKVAGGYEATDTTTRKLKNLFDQHGQAKNPHAVKNIEKVDSDLVNELKMRQVLDRTEGGVAQGSRNTLMGLTSGGVVGGPVGMAVGAGLGFAKDKYGRKAGKEILAKAGKSIIGADKAFNRLAPAVGAIPDRFSNMPSGINRALIGQQIQEKNDQEDFTNTITDKLGKPIDQLDASEKAAFVKIWLEKKNNPGMSDAKMNKIIAARFPGAVRKEAIDKFTSD